MGLASFIKPPLRALRTLWRAVRPAGPPPTPSTAPIAPEAPATSTVEPAPVEAPPPPAPPPQRREVTVYAEATPSPNARKFVCSVTVLERGSLSVTRAEDAARHPVAQALFAVPGVRTVFLAADFVTVTRDPSVAWEPLEPRLREVIAEALATA
jgi:hypothetical protein